MVPTIKKHLKKRSLIIISTLFLLLFLYIFPTKDDKNNLTNINKKLSNEYIYLIDINNYVARVSLVLKENNDYNKIKEIIDYLTIDSKSSLYIKEGFIGIIPKNTKLLSLTINDNHVNLNFSKNILDIKEEKIDNLLSSIIYSITSLKSSYQISIYVEGNILNKIKNTPIPPILDRTYGINKIYNLNQIKDTTSTTIYYISKYKDYKYFVPITLVNNKSEEKLKIIIEEMASKTIYQTNLISYLKNTIKINYEINEDNMIIKLEGNNFSSDNLIEETIYTLNLSIKENYNIKEVSYYIDNKIFNTYKL